MEFVADLESTCAALGSSDGVTYYKDNDCIECVKDLIRFLRRDDASHVLRRSLGKIGVVQSDLIPLLRDYASDQELLDLVLRLLVNLTLPELVLFREELPEDKVTRNHFIELQTHRQSYKKAFIDEKLWAVLAQNLGRLLKKDYSERSEDDGLVLERILLLVRNILQVPRDNQGERRTDDEASIHDQVLWVLHKSGIEDLLLFIASSEDETQYCLHVLEIICLMFREQDPKHLASADFQRSKEEKQQDEQELLRSRMREMEMQKQKFHQVKSSRHSRFGGTFTLANVKSISERDMIYHRPLTSMDNIDFNKEKRPKKIARNKRTPDDPDANKRRSTLAIRLFLKEFCVEFLHGAYNNLMSVVRSNLLRQKGQNNDETYYLRSIKFFMEFNREYKFRPELVIETLNKTCFHFVQGQMELYKDNFEHEKKNRPACLVWSRRMHLALAAYKELLMCLTSMISNKDVKIRDSGMVLRADVFYEPEYRELCLQQFSLYQSDKMTMTYLKDLVETTHVFTKLMEHMSKSSHVMISSKKVKKKSKPQKSQAKGGSVPKSDGFVSQRESNEQIWDNISSELSRILQEGQQLPEITAPFDAASEVPIDDQRGHAMYRIHEALKTNQPGVAVALLRASREVWPENDAFGPADADNEDEFMAMREILLADVPKPAGFNEPTTAENSQEEEANEEDNNILDQPEIEDEEDEEEETVVMQRVEQEFDFNGFVQRFAIKNVCNAYAILFANYEKNSDHTNHCIIKMFHRIAFDLKLPGLLFQFQILRVFQKIHKDYRLNPAQTIFRELNRFGKFLLQKFFEASQNNKYIWMELCFWKTSREAYEVVEGYGTQAASKKQKASFWCEEDEETLTRVFHQLKEMKENKEENESGDMLDSITAFFQESGKSRRQVARKLKEMALISDIREVTKKPLKMKAPREWGEEEIEQLTNLYKEFKEAMDPVNRILESLTIKRPKKRVVEKIMELGLCDDKKKLMKKRVRRGLKEGEPGYLESASESDSALEDSGDEDEEDGSSESEDSGEHEMVSHMEKVKPIIEAIAQEESLRSALEWLKSCIDDEKEDREGDADDIIDAPLVPISEPCISAMDTEKFTEFLQLLQISKPNDQEQYWRIPSNLSANALSCKSDFLSNLLEKNVDFESLNFNVLFGASSVKKTKTKKKKKKEKRGPNKWMPMRRVVDEDVAQRINEAIGITSEKKEKKTPPPRCRKKSGAQSNRKTPTRRKIISMDSDSDSDEQPRDEETNQTNESEEDDLGAPTGNANERSASKPSPKARRARLDSSDSSDSEDEPKKSQPRPRLESGSSSDDGVDDPWPTNRVPSDNDDEGKSKKPSLDSSSDEGVDDPMPIKRVPSEEDVRNRSRSSSSSSVSSRRSSFSSDLSTDSRSPIKYVPATLGSPQRSSSISRSPLRNDTPSVVSSASNTPKRGRYSPSPLKSEKKAKKARILDSSDDE